MTTPVYVRSTDGSNTDDGTTWALAKLDLIGSLAVDEAGGTVFVSDSHAESTAAGITLSFAGTNAAPMKILCVDDAAEPPTALATTGTVTTTGASPIIINGNIYVYGLTFNCGSGAVNASFTFDNAAASPNTVQKYEQCTFNMVGTGANTCPVIGAAANAYPSRIEWKDCHLKLANASHNIRLNLGEFVWEGGSIVSGGTAITTGLIYPQSLGEFAKTRISGVDLQNLGSASYLASAGVNGTLDVVYRNCRLPTSWTGGLVTGTLQARDRVEMYNCDSADTNYNLWIEDYCGSIVDNTSVYNDAGVDDGSAQGFSWLMTASANAEFPHMGLVSPEIVKWNDTVTGTLTVTVEIVHNSAGGGTDGALLDTECWLEVMYLGTSGAPLGTWISDRCGNMNLNSDAADQASSTATWTGDAAGWDTQKLVVSINPVEKGYIHARVVVAKASAAVYVDPLITVA